MGTRGSSQNNTNLLNDQISQVPFDQRVDEIYGHVVLELIIAEDVPGVWTVPTEELGRLVVVEGDVVAVVLAQDLHAELVVSADNVSRNVFADSAGAGHHESLVPGLVSQLPLQEDPEILPVVQMNGVVVGMISVHEKQG